MTMPMVFADLNNHLSTCCPGYFAQEAVCLGGGGVVSRSPDGLFAQQEREPIRGRPAVRGKRTYGGRPGQRVEEQGTWASRTQNHSEAGYGWPVDRGAWTAKTVKRPRQQPAHPQYANFWAPLTRKRHTMPHSAQPQHTKHWAPRTRKRHQQEHWLQRPTESSDLTQHAKGRTSDCPGPRKGTTTRRNVTQGGDLFVRVKYPETPKKCSTVHTPCDKHHLGCECHTRVFLSNSGPSGVPDHLLPLSQIASTSFSIAKTNAVFWTVHQINGFPAKGHCCDALKTLSCRQYGLYSVLLYVDFPASSFDSAH